MTSVADQAWFKDARLQQVLALLNGEGGEARVVGGAVRNALMGIDVTDMDIATTLHPNEVMRRATAAGIKCVPTGIEHGTVTLVVDGKPFEVTTLRRDVETDGRHAKVAYTDDWAADAERRDLTINALYADMSGDVVDHVGGLADIEAANIRFIGDASARISEDHLRILRFFRFFAQYGRGRPDAAGLKAAAQAKSKLSSLSAERIWAELRKLLGARDPGRALLWMRTTGVLTEILPETEKWGIDALPGLILAEEKFGWEPDPLVRLAAIVPPDAERLSALAERLKLANRERDRLVAFAHAPRYQEAPGEKELRERLYHEGRDGLEIRARLQVASAASREDIEGLQQLAGFQSMLRMIRAWEKPSLPVKGADLIAKGMAPGPDLGAKLATLEKAWIESGFRLDRDALLAQLPG